MSDFAIVIPTCNTNNKCLGYLDGVLTSIRLGGYENNPVIVCFDNCEFDYIDYFNEKFPFIHAIINEENNLGFAPNSNKGLRYVHKELNSGCFLVNFDTILPDRKYMEQVCNDGLATPAQIDLTSDQLTTVEELLEVLNNSQSKEIERTKSIKFTGFCMWMSKQLMDRIGYLNEIFVSAFEDDDICIRASLANLPVEETNIQVHHYLKNRQNASNSGAYTNDSLSLRELTFRRVWSIPKDVLHVNFNSWILDNFNWEETMRIV